MARKDYRYIGFEDENTITEIILYSMPKIARARKERLRYLESRGLGGSPLSGERVQGGEDTPKAQQILERKEKDKILSWLSTIETRVCDKIKHLSAKEKAFIREFYFSGRVVRISEVAEVLGIDGRVASGLKHRVRNKLRRCCTSVYHLFCLWREQDDIEMDERKSELDSLLNDGAA